MVGVIIFIPALAFSQTSDNQASQPDGTGGEAGAVSAQRVDETTLVLGEAAPAGGAGIAVSPFGFWDLVRMVLVLACVVGVIYIIFHFLKKAGTGRFASSESIRILGSQALPGNRAIYLVEVGGQVFMLGAGGDTVNLIAEITDKETVDAMILRAGEENPGQRRNFGEMVAGLLRSGQSSSLELMRGQRQRLERLR